MNQKTDIITNTPSNLMFTCRQCGLAVYTPNPVTDFASHLCYGAELCGNCMIEELVNMIKGHRNEPT